MSRCLLVAVLSVGSALVGPASGWAQAGTAGGGTAASSAQMALPAANDVLLTMFQDQFMAVAKAMPPEKYAFSPASMNIAGAKYDGVRTFAGEAKHVAQANYFFYGAVSGAKPGVDVKAIGMLKTKDEIVAALEQSFTFAHTALATLTAAHEGDPVDVDGLKTKGTVAAFAVAHGYDHYGQMVEYLRLNGITPPGSK